MTTETKAAQTVGDYDLRGADFETVLIGPVTDRIADSDREIRRGPDGWANGFPNWGMYRTALAGDSIHTESLRQWVVAFSIAYASTGGIRADAYSDEMATVAGWDALHMLIHSRPMQPYTVTADRMGVHHRTYRCLRDTVYARLRASLDEYWIRMQVAIRQVTLRDKFI